MNSNLNTTNVVLTNTSKNLGIEIWNALSNLQFGNINSSNDTTSPGDIENNAGSVVGDIANGENDKTSSSDSGATTNIDNINKEADKQKVAEETAKKKAENEAAKNSAQEEAQKRLAQQRLQAEAQRKAREEKDKRDKNTAVDFILKKLYTPKKGTKASDIKDPVKRTLFKKLGKTIYEKDSDTLAKKLGVGENGPLLTRLNQLGVIEAVQAKLVTSTIKQASKIISKKYAKGSKNIPEDMIAEIGENGKEIVYRSADGSILTPLGKGDMVFTNEMSKNLWNMAQNRPLSTIPIEGRINSSNVVNNNSSSGRNLVINVGDIILNGVEDMESFKQKFPQEFGNVFAKMLATNKQIKNVLGEQVNDILMPNHNSLSAKKYIK